MSVKLKFIRLAIPGVAMLAWMATSTPAAQSSAVPPTPAAHPAAVQPTPALESLSVFAGAWKCSGASAGPDGSETAFKVSMDVKFIYNGHFMRWQEVTSIDGATVGSAEYIWAWDASNSRFNVNAFGSYGQRVELTTPGWSANSMIMQGTTSQPDGTAIPSRITVTQTGAKSFNIDVAVELGGQSVDVSHSTCARSGRKNV